MASDLISNSLNGTGFITRLEKHIDDYRKGRAEMSRETSADLRLQDQVSNDILARLSPSMLASYGAYSTAFTYDQRARFVYGMNQATTLYSTIRSLIA